MIVLPFGREKILSPVEKLSEGFKMELEPIGREESVDNTTISGNPKTWELGFARETCDTGTVGVGSPGRKAVLPLLDSCS